jgi:hypothetical protein
VREARPRLGGQAGHERLQPGVPGRDPLVKREALAVAREQQPDLAGDEPARRRLVDRHAHGAGVHQQQLEVGLRARAERPAGRVRHGPDAHARRL